MTIDFSNPKCLSYPASRKYPESSIEYQSFKSEIRIPKSEMPFLCHAESCAEGAQYHFSISE